MINFMIFGDTAINMALVISMRQKGSDVVLQLNDQDSVRVANVSIDHILTAQAAGQARIIATSAEMNDAKTDLSQNHTSFSQRCSSRFREPMQNDPQAMKSIGRR